MARIRLVITRPTAIEEAVLHSTQVRDALSSTAETIAQRAKAIAPVDLGDYVASIGTSEGRSQNGRPMFRVLSTDPKAGIIEFGSGKPGGTFAVFRRAAAGIGIYLTSDAAKTAESRG
jgi:hypothetical protein